MPPVPAPRSATVAPGAICMAATRASRWAYTSRPSSSNRPAHFDTSTVGFVYFSLEAGPVAS